MMVEAAFWRVAETILDRSSGQGPPRPMPRPRPRSRINSNGKIWSRSRLAATSAVRRWRGSRSPASRAAPKSGVCRSTSTPAASPTHCADSPKVRSTRRTDQSQWMAAGSCSDVRAPAKATSGSRISRRAERSISHRHPIVSSTRTFLLTAAECRIRKRAAASHSSIRCRSRARRRACCIPVTRRDSARIADGHGSGPRTGREF